MKIFPPLPILLASLLMLLSLGVATAAEDQAAVVEEDLGPVVMLQSATHRLLVKMEQDRERIKEDGSHLMALANEVLLTHFDTSAMARWVLGSHWKIATSEQQRQFSQEFEVLVIRFYVSALFDDPKLLDEIIELGDRIITYEPVTWDAATKKVEVKSIFKVPSGLEIPVDFKLYFAKSSARWLIYDVNVDGISLITNYRNSFGAEIRKDGFTAMLQRLIEKNRNDLDKVAAGNRPVESVLR